MTEQLANNAQSTLNGAIDNVVTSLTVANGTSFPSSGNFRIIIDSEIILVGARSGNTLSSLTRGLEGTTAAAHSNGALVTHDLTKGGLDQYLSERYFPAPVPAARVYHSANQAIATSTDTVLSFNSERFDTDTIHDTVTNNSRLTCKTAGKYLITCAVEWEAVAAGTFRNFGIRVNGTTYIALQLQPPCATNGLARQTLSAIYDLAVNDYVEVTVSHDRGSNLNILSAANYTPEFSMARIA